MDAPETQHLRNALVDELKAEGHVSSPAVEAALRTVPRHLFVPWLEPKDGCLTGVGLGSLDMVLFRSEVARYGEKISRRWGETWQGAGTDELKVAVYPEDADVPLEPQQLPIGKPGSLTVLERLQ